MNLSNDIITVRIQRYDPSVDEEPSFQTYQVSYEEGMTLLRVLIYVYEELDPSLAFRYSCRITFCGMCGVMVNGGNVLACKRMVKPGESLTLQPLKGFRLIRDLVVDFEQKAD